MHRFLQSCVEISSPGSDLCPGATHPDILAIAGADGLTLVFTVLAGGVVLFLAGGGLWWLMEGRHR